MFVFNCVIAAKSVAVRYTDAATAAAMLAGLLIMFAAPVSASTTVHSAPPVKGDIVYKGTYDVKVTTPPRPSRRVDLADLLNMGATQALSGAITFVARFDGAAVSMSASGTGGVRNATLSGTARDGRCRLTDVSNTLLYEGACDRTGFAGTIASTQASGTKVRGAFDTRAASVVDGAERSRQLTAEQQTNVRYEQSDKLAQARTILTLKSRADAGDAAALSDLGDIYADGDGVRADQGIAVGYWEKAAAKGNGWSAYRLGVIFYNSALDSEDKALAAKANRYLVQCARSDAATMPRLRSNADIVAQCQEIAGRMAKRGFGTAVDHAAATRWFRSCAARGSTRCQEHLAGLRP